MLLLVRLMVRVARERFELSSTGPKPAMLDHYTTGLQFCFLWRVVCFMVVFFLIRVPVVLVEACGVWWLLVKHFWVIFFMGLFCVVFVFVRFCVRKV